MRISDKFRKWINLDPEHITIIGNFSSLTLLQAANYIFPLISLPYLVRVLGPEMFGLIAFAQAFVQYFVVITDYSFGLSASRDVSVNRNDRASISRIYSTVLTSQLLLMAACFVILAAVVLISPRFRDNWPVYLLTFGIIPGSVMFPAWLFFGMERMGYLAARNAFVKAVFTVAIFVFIRRAEDYIYVPLINFLGYITAGVFGLWSLFGYFKVRYSAPGFSDVKKCLSDGWHIFLSMISFNLYSATNIFALGLFTNNTIVGYYAAADKVITAVSQLYTPLFNAVYPYITRVASNAKDRVIVISRKIYLIVAPISVAFFLAFSLFARPLSLLVFGSKYSASISVMKLLSPVLLVMPLIYVMANLVMIPLKLERYLSKVYVFGGLIDMVLVAAFVVILDMGAGGMALAVMTTYVLIAVFMMLFLKRYENSYYTKLP